MINSKKLFEKYQIQGVELVRASRTQKYAACRSESENKEADSALQTASRNIYLRLTFAWLLSFMYLGCAFNNSRDDINQRENKTIEEKNRVLRDNYNLVTGFYQGTLHLPNEDRTVTLGVYTLEVKEGSNSSGESVFKPVLKAVYRQLYPIEVPVVLDGRFVPETGELTFVNAMALPTVDSLHTINGSIKGTKILGVAKTPTGVIGDLDLNFVQKKVDAPTEGDQDQIAEKLREQFEHITGTYVGKITDGDSNEGTNHNEWDVEIGIYTLEVKAGTKPNGEAFFSPVLKAVFKQKSPIVPNLILEAQFIAETGQVIFMNPNASAGDLHSINAKLINQSIQGTAKRASGLWGQIHLEFTSKNVITDPSGEENEFNRKLREQFQKITGTYRGSILREATSTDPRREWKTELGLYIIDEKYGTTPGGEPKFRPALKARFKQLAPVAPNVILDVRYIAESDQLLLSIREATGGPVPAPTSSDGLNSFTGKLKDNLITGTASKATGYWGELQMQFITKTVDSPSFGDQEDYNRRLIEEYNTVVGNYTGTISPKGLAAFNVEVKIYILQEAAPNGTIPKLKAYYRRTSDEFNATDLIMNVEYKTELSPAGIDMSGQRTNGSLIYFVILNGSFKDNEIKGQYQEQRGQTGPFRLKRVQSRGR